MQECKQTLTNFFAFSENLENLKTTISESCRKTLQKIRQIEVRSVLLGKNVNKTLTIFFAFSENLENLKTANSEFCRKTLQKIRQIEVRSVLLGKNVNKL